jgi:hypothetical protein
MTDETEDDAEVQRGGRTRSPRHPSFDLGEAVEKARALYATERTNPVAYPVAMKAWGYSGTSSSGKQALGTMRQFGLVEPVKIGAVKAVRLTRLAQRILILNAPEQRAQLVAALQEAARTPAVHQAVLEHFRDGLPSDASLRFFLIHEKRFHDDSADGFIRELRASLSFAEFDTTGSAPGPQSSEEPAGGTAEETTMPTNPTAPPVTPHAPTNAAQDVTAQPRATFQPQQTEFKSIAHMAAPRDVTVKLALSRGKWATLTAPEEMTEQEWKNMRLSLDAAKVGFLIDEPRE